MKPLTFPEHRTTVRGLLMSAGASPQLIKLLTGLPAQEIPVTEKPFYLHGVPGTGKTVMGLFGLIELAQPRINQMKKNKYSYERCEEILSDDFMAFKSVPDLLFDIKQTFRDTSLTDPISWYRKTPYLMLDDIGAEKSTEWAAEQLTYLIDYRMGCELPTIVTSNYSLEELEGIPGYQRMASRLYQTNTPIHLTKQMRNL